MIDEPRVEKLLDEAFDSGLAPEEACGDCPELLPEVRRRWRQMRLVEAELDALFPTPRPEPAPDARRILAAIDRLPEGEREAFDLVRIQGMTQTEAAQLLGVSVMTVNRRLNRGLQLLAAALADLYPGGEDPASS